MFEVVSAIVRIPDIMSAFRTLAHQREDLASVIQSTASSGHLCRGTSLRVSWRVVSASIGAVIDPASACAPVHGRSGAPSSGHQRVHPCARGRWYSRAPRPGRAPRRRPRRARAGAATVRARHRGLVRRVLAVAWFNRSRTTSWTPRSCRVVGARRSGRVRGDERQASRWESNPNARPNDHRPGSSPRARRTRA
jgi:hypothetical protein